MSCSNTGMIPHLLKWVPNYQIGNFHENWENNLLGHTNLKPSSSDFQTKKVRREGEIILLILFFILEIKIMRRAITIKSRYYLSESDFKKRALK